MSYKELARKSPYVDDFNEVNNFIRIMFRPGRAVQSRELTQLQTILQAQIERISSHIFQDSSPVVGADINLSSNKPSVVLYPHPYKKVAGSYVADETETLTLTESHIGKVYQNSKPSSGVLPSKTITITGFKQDIGQPVVIYYEFSGSDGVIDEIFYDSNYQNVSDFAIRFADNPGRALVATAERGLIYVNGFFVVVPKQNIVIQDNVDFSNDILYTVGYNVAESILTSESGELGKTLLDPANGSYNYNAPGADRYRLEATLAYYDSKIYDDLDKAFKDAFFSFIYVKNGKIVSDQKNKPQYSDILDLLARRTYDESGNYTVNDFSIIMKEAEGLVDAEGMKSMTGYRSDLPDSDPRKTDPSKYLVGEISPGKAYVFGYEIDKQLPSHVLVPKGRDTAQIPSATPDAPIPFYFVAKIDSHSGTYSSKIDGTLTGTSTSADSLGFSGMERIDILDESDVVIASAILTSIDRNGNFVRIYIINDRLDAVGSVSKEIPTLISADLSASSTYKDAELAEWTKGSSYSVDDIVFYSGSSIYRASATFTGATTDSDPPNDTARWSLLKSNTSAQLAPSTVPLQFNALMSARSICAAGDQTRKIYLALDESDSENIIPIAGGSPTPFITTISESVVVTDSISDGHQFSIIVQTPVSNFSDGSTTNLINSGTGVSFAPSNISNSSIELDTNNGIVSALVKPTANVTDDNGILYPANVWSYVDVSNTDFKFVGNSITKARLLSASGDWKSGQVVFTCKVNLTEAKSDIKQLQVDGTADFVIADSSQDICLIGKGNNENTDLYQIIDIIQLSNNKDSDLDAYTYSNNKLVAVSGGVGRSLTVNEKLSLRFDNGQRDCWLDYGSVSGFAAMFNSPNKAKSDVPTAYRIKYSHFTNSGDGIVTINGYSNAIGLSDDNYDAVPVYRSDKFGGFDLINCIDYRKPITKMLGGSSSALNLMCPFSSVVCENIKYFLGRYDKIWLDKRGKFGLTSGVSSVKPGKPANQDNTMLLFILGISQYTFNPHMISIETEKNARYTMKDIGSLDERITRLEDYVSLNMLEKNASDLQVVDPETGFDRFKSGIFTDGFKDLSSANSHDPNYRIALDGNDQSITTPVEFHNISMEFAATAMQNNIKKWANIVTLKPSGNKELASNLLASSTINANPYDFYVWRGAVAINPSVDTWYETKYLPTKTVTVGSYNPPPGFNPIPRVDEIKQIWTGVVPGIVVYDKDPVIQGYLGDISGSGQFSDSAGRGTARDYLEQLTHNQYYKSALQTSLRLSTIAGSEVTLPPSTTLPNLTGLTSLSNPSTYSLGNWATVGQAGSNFWAPDAQAKGVWDSLESLRDLWQVTPPSGDLFQTPGTITGTGSESNSGHESTTMTVTQTTKIKTWDTSSNKTSTSTSDRYIDTTTIPWMRSRMVYFIARACPPGISVKCYLDNKEIPVSYSGAYKRVDGTIATNGDGTIEGWFVIPPKTISAGKKQFEIRDANTGVSYGTTSYTSQGYLTTRQKTITTIRSVEVVTHSEAISQTVDVNNQVHYYDPLAQSFLVDIPGGCFLSEIDLYFATKSGDFTNADKMINNKVLSDLLSDQYGETHPKDYDGGAINSTDPDSSAAVDNSGVAFLRSNQNGIPITVYIVEMENGQPTPTMVPLSKTTIFPQNIISHPTIPSAGKTTIPFNDPIYLDEGTEYAMVISTPSKEYYLWKSTLGKGNYFANGIGTGTWDESGNLIDGASPENPISQQPYLGSLFMSQNAKTWTADQRSDLAFTIRYLQFESKGNVYLVDSKTIDDLGTAGQSNPKTWSQHDVKNQSIEVKNTDLKPGDVTLYGTTDVSTDGLGSYGNDKVNVYKTLKLNTSDVGSGVGSSAIDKISSGFKTALVHNGVWGNIPTDYTTKEALEEVRKQPPLVVDKTTGISVANPAFRAFSPGRYDSYAFLLNRIHGHSVFPIIGTLTFPDVGLKFSHAFFNSSSGLKADSVTFWNNMRNLEENDVRLYSVDGTAPNSLTSSGGGRSAKFVDDGVGYNNVGSNNSSYYTISAALSTDNPNLSPVLDKEQMRAIFYEYDIQGYYRYGSDEEFKFGGYTNSYLFSAFNDGNDTSSYAEVYALGEIKIGTTYKSENKPIVYVGGSPNVFYAKVSGADVKFVSDAAATDHAASPRTYHLNEFNILIEDGSFVQMPAYTPPFVDGHPGAGIGDAGSYVSKTVNLLNPANDLRLIMDVKRDRGAYLNVYYKTQADVSYRVWSDFEDKIDIATPFFRNRKCKILYAYGPPNSNGDVTVKNITPSGTIGPRMTVTGIEEPGGGAPTKYRIYVSQLTDPDVLAEGLSYSDSDKNINGVPNDDTGHYSDSGWSDVFNVFIVDVDFIGLDSTSSGGVTLKKWRKNGKYVIGDIVSTYSRLGNSPDQVLANWRLWKSNAYIADIWSAGGYNEDEITVVSESTGKPFIAYRALTYTSESPTAAASTQWEKLVDSEGKPKPAYALGAVPSSLGTAWDSVPTMAVRSKLKTLVTDEWKPMSPTSNISPNKINENQYYEITYVPKISPQTEYNQFVIKVDFRSKDSRVSVPKVKNLRAVAMI